MPRRLLVTLVTGAKHTILWREYAEQSWLAYAERFRIPLLVLEAPLDVSERAGRRSMSWQKCLLCADPRVQEADQVLWLDADIVASPHAPNVFDSVPVDHFAAVDAWAYPSRAAYDQYLRNLYAQMRLAGIPFIDNPTPREFYEAYGLPDPPDSVLQAGLFVFSPARHRAIFEHTYAAYEERGGPEWNFEMRPLSYEIVKNTPVTWLDPRFNAMWGYERDVTYVEEMRWSRLEDRVRRISRRLKYNFVPPRQRRCAQQALERAYFLHFAGCNSDMQLLPRRKA